MSGTERALSYLNFAAVLVLLWRLTHGKIYRTYRSLFWYWLVQAVGTMALLSTPMYTYQYLYIYWAVQTITIVMAVFVVQDLYRITFLEHPAVASFARRSVVVAVVIAAVIALSGIRLDFTILPGQFPAIHRFATFERSMNFIILLFLLLISALLLWFPIKVRRNIVVYISGFLLFSASRSFGLLLTNLLPQSDTRMVSTALLGLTLACLVIWIIGLQSEGELATATPGYRRNPEAMQRLSHQLDSINAALTRFVRH
jgi:magnesium-transporting ATPase (P-type)